MERERQPAGRVIFLDNLRVFLVLTVVALHAAAAYTKLIPWWYAADSQQSPVFDLFLAVTDGFTMPALFFVAGYFALPSLRRHGSAGFLAAKARRLLLPLVALTLFYCPVISYIAFLRRGGTGTFIAYWLRELTTLGDWSFRVFANVEAVRPYFDALTPFHLWFLAVLLVFFVGLAAGRGLLGRSGKRPAPGGLGLGLAAVVAVGLAEAAVQVVIPDPVWARFGPFVVFQPARLPLYVGFFALGLLAETRGWFTTVRLPGRAWVWFALAVLTGAAMLAAGFAAAAPGGKPAAVLIAHGLARTAFNAAMIGLLAPLAFRRFNRPRALSAALAASSYDIYLAHLPVVVVLQYLLLGVALSVYLKFAIVLLASTLICFAGSRIILGRRLVWVPAALTGVFGLCLWAWG